MGTHLKHLTMALLLSNHHICFCGEIRNILVYIYILVEKRVLSGFIKVCSSVKMIKMVFDKSFIRSYAYAITVGCLKSKI